MTREATEVRICNQKGLHARAAAKLVRLAEQYDAAVEVTKDDATVTATSILGLMMLGAALGTRLTLSATGNDADIAVREIADLIRRGFDE